MSASTTSTSDALLIELGIIYRALVVLKTKREDYSGTQDPYRNFRAVESLFDNISPAAGATMRMQDKLARIARRAEQGALAGESVFYNDLPDLVNYAGIVAGLLSEGDNEALVADGLKLRGLLDEILP